jgi:peptide/nickel transport system ATP-binding protein
MRSALASTHPAKTLTVSHLSTRFATSRGALLALDDLSFEVAPGEVLGLVGESGSGKSVTLRSILHLLPSYAETTGSVRWGEKELIGASSASLRALRGRDIAMIFQEPMTALNPVLTVHRQIDESLCAHSTLDKRQRRERAIELLDLVGIPAASSRLDEYPHQFSGGMRQRVMIAIALASEPGLLLADEPTTALDVTIQDQILKLILSLRERLGMSVIFVTHDLGVVAQTCDRVAVMYAGGIVETGSVLDVFRQPRHPYTRGLLGSVPQTGDERKPLLSIEGTPPSLADMPMGCPFHPRCSFAEARCRQEKPSLSESVPGRLAACYRQDAVIAAGGGLHG